MCDSRLPDCCCCCCDKQGCRLQPCNDLQMCPPCVMQCPNLPKLKSTTPQQNRISYNMTEPPQRNSLNSSRKKSQSKKSTPKKERNSSNSSDKKGNLQQKKNCVAPSGNSGNTSNSKKPNKKANSMTFKPKIESPQNLKQNEGAEEINAASSNTELEDTADCIKCDMDNNLTISANDAMIQMLQKSMDHTMRAYFMHTMEKMECLSAQLLQNEFVIAKMHLDIVEKMSKLNQRNLAQFQAVVERLNCLLRDRNCQQKYSYNDQRHYNSDEDENDECSCDNMEPHDLKSNSKHSDQQRTTDLSRGSLQATTKCDSAVENCVVAQISNQSGTTSRKGSQISDCLSEGQIEAKYCCECQKKVECLQQELESSKKELQESNKRLQERMCREELPSEYELVAEQPCVCPESCEEPRIPYTSENYKSDDFEACMQEADDLTGHMNYQNRQSTLKEEDCYVHREDLEPFKSGSDVEACCPECKCNLKKALLDSKKYSSNRGR